MGERQHANIQPTPPMFDQRVGGLAPAAIDIVREEIAGAFRDKLGVSMGGVGLIQINFLTIFKICFMFPGNDLHWRFYYVDRQ